MIPFNAYPDWVFTNEQNEEGLAVIRDAINLLHIHRPDLTVEQMIKVIAGEYRHSAAGDTDSYLAAQAEPMFPSP